MESWPETVLARIADGSLLPPECFTSIDLDSVLEARDRDAEFEAEWLRLYEVVNDDWKSAELTDRQKSDADDVRRESFLAVFRVTKHHDIAAQVSDDFDLMARGHILGRADPFLEQLWRTYDAGQIPKST